MDKVLFEFNYDCGRMGGLTGLFVATDAEVEALYGREIYFGEVLGKHSEIVCDFDSCCVEEKTRDQEFIAKLIEIVGDTTVSGFNPLSYAEEEEE
jgi:hypothetical protein